MAKSAAPAPSYDTNQPDAETNVQAAAPAKRKPGRPKGSKNKTRAASYDGKAAAPSPEPEQPDRLNEQSTALKAIADRMARKPNRRGRPPGSKNKPKTVAA